MGFDAGSERALPLPACGERGGVRGTLDLHCVGQRSWSLAQIAHRVEFSTRGESPSPGALRAPTSPRERGEVTRGTDQPNEISPQPGSATVLALANSASDTKTLIEAAEIGGISPAACRAQIA
jgi:hypothetical protein